MLVLGPDVVSPSAYALVLGVAFGLAADGDALGLVLGLGGLRQGYGEHAVAERRLRLVLLDRKRQRDHPLEAAIVALAEAALLVLRLRPLLAPDGQDVVVHEHLDILLIQAGQFGRDTHILVGLDHLDARPSRHTPEQGRRIAEVVEHVIEEPVHLAVEGQEGADLLTAPAGDGRLFATPGDQITKSHDVLHSPVTGMHLRSRGRVPAGSLASIHSGYAALGFSTFGWLSCSMVLASPPAAISIRRGFMASGTSRLSSMVSRPLSRLAPLTFT